MLLRLSTLYKQASEAAESRILHGLRGENLAYLRPGLRISAGQHYPLTACQSVVKGELAAYSSAPNNLSPETSESGSEWSAGPGDVSPQYQFQNSSQQGKLCQLLRTTICSLR